MSAILKIRNTYYPLIGQHMPALIDLQTKLIVFETKLNKFQQSGMVDMTFAPTNEDREEHLRLETLMTGETNKFAEDFLQQYRSIAEQMSDLKDAINFYIYRPIKDTDIDRD